MDNDNPIINRIFDTLEKVQQDIYDLKRRVDILEYDKTQADHDISRVRDDIYRIESRMR